MRLEQTLVPRAEAGAGRTQVRWYPTHGYQREQPSRLLAPALPLGGEEGERDLTPPALPLLTAEVISTPPLTCRCPNEIVHIQSEPQKGSGQVERCVRWRPLDSLGYLRCALHFVCFCSLPHNFFCSRKRLSGWA